MRKERKTDTQRYMNARLVGILVAVISALTSSPTWAVEALNSGTNEKQTYNFFVIDEGGVERTHIIISGHTLTFKKNLYLGVPFYESVQILDKINILDLPLIVLLHIEALSRGRVQSGVAYEVDSPEEGRTYYVIGENDVGMLYLYEFNVDGKVSSFVKDFGTNTGTTDLSCVANLLLMPPSFTDH